MRDLPYVDKSDVYSFGIICWEILTRENLYPDMHPLSVGYKVMMEGLRPAIPPETPDVYSKIMESCWDEEIDVRPTFEDLITQIEQINVPYLTKFVTKLKDFKGLQSGQVEASETDPSIELDEINQEVSPPTGEVTMVICDIGQWEMLWSDTSIPMVKAMGLYAMLLRREMRHYDGYEVNSEGRMCRIVFQDPLDALEWCMVVQLELLKVDWPEELLNKPYCAVSKKGDTIIRRGLVVAMAISSGIPTISLNPLTNRAEYTGAMTIKTASICKLAQYGQVLVGESTMVHVRPNLCELVEVEPKVTDVGDYTFHDLGGSEHITQVLPGKLAQRNFTAETQSKPHLVRGVSDFSRSRFTDRRDTDPNSKPASKPSSLRSSFDSSAESGGGTGANMENILEKLKKVEDAETTVPESDRAVLQREDSTSMLRGSHSMPSSPIATRARSIDNLGRMVFQRKKSRASLEEEDKPPLPPPGSGGEGSSSSSTTTTTTTSNGSAPVTIDKARTWTSAPSIGTPPS